MARSSDDIFKQGRPTEVDKEYIFDIGEGENNPRVRANATTKKLEVSDDGVTFTAITELPVLTASLANTILNTTTDAHTMSQDSSRKVLSQANRSISAGAGLTGGGTLAANRTINMGTPSSVTSSSSNSASGNTHSHSLSTATIGALTSNLSFNAVGSYAMAYRQGSTIQNSTYAGSGMRVAGVQDNNSSTPGVDQTHAGGIIVGPSGSIATGTWRAMGRVNSGNIRGVLLFLRVQ